MTFTLPWSDMIDVVAEINSGMAMAEAITDCLATFTNADFTAPAVKTTSVGNVENVSRNCGCSNRRWSAESSSVVMMMEPV